MSKASPDPRLPIPDKPGGVLPRIAYQAPEDADTYAVDDAPKKESEAAPPAAKPAPAEDDTPKPRLKEATPEFDTIEARRKMRIIVGAVGITALLGVAAVMIHLVSRGQQSNVGEAAAPAAPDPAIEQTRRENAARGLLDEARLYDKKGQPKQAMQRLDRLMANYSNTQASNDARSAIERWNKRLPLFPEGDIIAAQAPDPTPEPAPQPKSEVVNAAPVVPPSPETKATSKAAAITPPPVAPEPFRDTKLPRERAEVAARALPEGFRPRAEAGVHPSGWPNEITCDRDGSAMVLVPAGTFTIGNAQGRPAERPEREVELSAYYIDQHEVSIGQYNHYLKSVGKPPREADGDADRPLTRVTWDEAQDFLKWAGKALPTEPQWEKAARATDARIYPWGNEKPAWDPPRAARQVDPVATYENDLSPYGVFDLSGNAWEWTSDWFEARAYQSDRFKAADPQGPTKPASRIPEVAVRGGSADWDVAWRSGMRADARLPYLGFRGVLPLERPRDLPPTQAPPNRPEPDTRKIIPF